MNKIILLLASLMLSTSAVAAGRLAAAEATIAKAVQSTAGQRFVSALTGKPFNEVAAMTAQARAAAVVSSANAADAAVVANMDTLLAAISASPKSADDAVSAFIASGANQAVIKPVQSARSLLGAPKGVGQSSLGANSEAALAMLKGRVEAGDLAAGTATSFRALVAKAQTKLGFDVVGPGAATCMQSYPARLVGNLLSLMKGLDAPGALANTKSAFAAMTEKSKALFQEKNAAAQERVCGLAGQGYRCQILNPSMCAL